MKYKWFIGIDISKKTLDVALYDSNKRQSENHAQVDNDPAGFSKILSWLKTKKVAIKSALFCMEHTGIYGLNLFVFLEEKKLHYAALPPYELKRSLGLTRGKSDKIDSFNIARYAYLHRDEIKRLCENQTPDFNSVINKKTCISQFK